VFLVGCPRSGTTWVQRLLACHPGIATGQESNLFEMYIGPQLRSCLDQAMQRPAGTGKRKLVQEIYRTIEPVDVAGLARLILAENHTVTGLAEFFQYWVRMEATVKATGDGLRMSLPEVEVTP
jgi:hypothetical protein